MDKDFNRIVWGAPVSPINLKDGSASYAEADDHGQDIFVNATDLTNAYVGTSIQDGTEAIVVYGSPEISSDQTRAYRLDPKNYPPSDIDSFRGLKCS